MSKMAYYMTSTLFASLPDLGQKFTPLLLLYPKFTKEPFLLAESVRATGRGMLVMEREFENAVLKRGGERNIQWQHGY
jgi:hypothetical protein